MQEEQRKNIDGESFGLVCLKLFEDNFCQWFALDLSNPGSRMEVPLPTLAAVDKGQKCARPVMLPRPLVEGIFTGLIQNKIFNYSFEYFVGQNWNFFINFG